MAARHGSIFSRELVLAAIRDSFPKLDPRLQIKNPVMFIVELGSVVTTTILFIEIGRGHTGQLWFVGVIAVWLWLTVLLVILGAALNAEAERQTARDSTVGAERPPGLRGATVADDVPPYPEEGA